MATRRLIILGSTGSIGTQALDVVAHLNREHEAGRSPDKYQVVGLAAGNNTTLLNEQAARFGVRHIALHSGAGRNSPGDGPSRFTGPGAAESLVREVDCDIVLAAIVGSAGLPATLAAVELSRTVALANKETLVAAGELVVKAAVASGAKLLPVDSEHAGLWQCLAGSIRGSAPPLMVGPEVRKVYLTASGGPFRTWSRLRIDAATPEQALKHPTWSMGPKVTVDSASLMNKALELIEAHWLFGLSPDRLGAIIHPQSIVHAIVEYADGSSISQWGAPDMKCPIQHALSWPQRAAASCRRLDFSELRSLEFEPPDAERFPAISLAFEAMARGGTAGAVLNAANEAAVAGFLAGHIPFGRIAPLVRGAMDAVKAGPLADLAAVTDAERLARAAVAQLMGDR